MSSLSKKVIFILINKLIGKEKEILEYVDQYQLEEKYGGKLENLKSYWPPKSTNSSFDEFNINNINDITMETTFYSVDNDMEFFVEKEEKLKYCGENCVCKIY